MILKAKNILFVVLAPSLIWAQTTSQLIENKMDTYRKDHKVSGICVGVIHRDDHHIDHQVISKGFVSQTSAVDVNAYTLFRIGPLTELLTASVLAYFVHEHIVSLNDPISKFFSRSIRLPTYKGREITIGDLATHTSGLPDLPYAVSSRGSFTIGDMYRLLENYKLNVEPGTCYEPSSFGYALLSYVLSRASKRSFQSNIAQFLTQPLRLENTVFSLSSDQKKRSAIGYEGLHGMTPVFNEKSYSVFLGANGAYSTVQDLLSFLSFNLLNEQTSLNAIVPILQTPYHTFDDFSMGLGWKIKQIHHDKSSCMYLHGTFFGFGVFMACVPDHNTGVVVLTNQGNHDPSLLGDQIVEMLLR